MEQAAAEERARRMTRGRHADKWGEWIVIDGVRTHYRGRLQGVTELGFGRGLLHLHPAFELSALDNPASGEVQIGTSEEHPFDINTDAVIGVSLQPAAWTKPGGE